MPQIIHFPCISRLKKWINHIPIVLLLFMIKIATIVNLFQIFYSLLTPEFQQSAFFKKHH